MGHVVHHALIVTSWDGEAIERAHVAAPSPKSPVSPRQVNGYRSFVLWPHGSKAGWSASETGDMARASFIRWLRSQAYDDGSSPYEWACIEYGDDKWGVGDRPTVKVVDHAWKGRRS